MMFWFFGISSYIHPNSTIQQVNHYMLFPWHHNIALVGPGYQFALLIWASTLLLAP